MPGHQFQNSVPYENEQLDLTDFETDVTFRTIPRRSPRCRRSAIEPELVSFHPDGGLSGLGRRSLLVLDAFRVYDDRKEVESREEGVSTVLDSSSI